MEMLTALQTSLVALYDRDSRYYTDFPGSWVSDAVYQFDYAALGGLLSELLPVTEGRPFDVSGIFDGQNAFEEFVCGVLHQLFQERQVVIGDDGGFRIRLEALRSVFAECRTA